MYEEDSVKMCDESLDRLLRSNISLHINKTITSELIDCLVTQIVDSIEFLLSNNK